MSFSLWHISQGSQKNLIAARDVFHFIVSFSFNLNLFSYVHSSDQNFEWILKTLFVNKKFSLLLTYVFYFIFLFSGKFFRCYIVWAYRKQWEMVEYNTFLDYLSWFHSTASLTVYKRIWFLIFHAFDEHQNKYKWRK